MITGQDLGALGGVAALIAVAFGIAATGERKPKPSPLTAAGDVLCSVVTLELPPQWVARPGYRVAGRWQAAAKRGDHEHAYTACDYGTKRAADVGAKRLANRLNYEARSRA